MSDEEHESTTTTTAPEKQKTAGDEQGDEKNPARARQEKRQRVPKPGPHTIDQSQDDVAHPQSPLDTPR